MPPNRRGHEPSAPVSAELHSAPFAGDPKLIGIARPATDGRRASIWKSQDSGRRGGPSNRGGCRFSRNKNVTNEANFDMVSLWVHDALADQ